MNFKVVVAGDPGVGKTNLLCGLTRAAPSPHHSPTIGVDLL
jgi:GTPase SAR1 family protein